MFQVGFKQKGSTLQSTAQIRKADINISEIRRALGVQVIPKAESGEAGREDGLWLKNVAAGTGLHMYITRLV